MKVKVKSRPTLYQAPLSMGFFQAILLEWIAISFSRGSSQPRDQTRVSHIVDRRLTVWATREVPLYEVLNYLCCPKGVFKTDFKVLSPAPFSGSRGFFWEKFQGSYGVSLFAPLTPWERNGVFSLHCMPSERVFKRTTLRAWPLLLEARMDWPDLRKVKRLTMTWIMPIKWSKKRWLNSEQTVTSTNSRTEISVQFRCSVVSDSLQAHGR